MPDYFETLHGVLLLDKREYMDDLEVRGVLDILGGLKSCPPPRSLSVPTPSTVFCALTLQPFPYSHLSAWPPTSLIHQAHVTHPQLQATFQLPIIGVKKNPQSRMYTTLGIMTKVYPTYPQQPYNHLNVSPRQSVMAYCLNPILPRTTKSKRYHSILTSPRPHRATFWTN